MKLTERERNLTLGIKGLFTMNGATRKEIINVCKEILRQKK